MLWIALCAFTVLSAPVQDPVPVETGGARRSAEVPQQQPDPAALPRCRVFGRALDEQGRPVEGVEVRLGTVGEPWRAGATGPDGKRLPGSYQTRTAADGRFSFDLPVPTSSWVDLTVEPGPYLAMVGRDFGPAGGRDQPPLFAGDNDLGDFPLAATGAIAGRVVGPDGAPLLEARASVDGAHPNGLVLNGDRQADGSYLIGHVPPGTYRVQAVCEGYESGLSTAIEVARERTSAAPDIALAAAAVVAGRVVDQDGRPIEGVKVWGWPVGSGGGAGGRTGPDGRFQVALPEPDAYRFEFHAEGYRSIEAWPRP